MSVSPSSRPRFYTTVSVEPAEGGHAIALNGRTPRSPKGASLILPTPGLAERVAREWRDQGATVDFTKLGLTRLAYTALDLTDEAAAAVVADQARHAGFDLLRHRADPGDSLAKAEAAAFDPWLAWADETLGVRLEPVVGIASVPPAPETFARVRALTTALDRFSLVGLAYAGALLGSTVLAFAALRGAIDAAEAYELSRLDEAWQEARWGEDEEAKARTAARRRDARLVGDWFAGLRE
jgi:chaperone required for assembly of F1-ATPase